MTKEHIVPQRTFFIVWAALMSLMVLTAVLSRVNLGDWSTVIALAIAAVKAFLVLMIFMHLRYENYKIIAVVLFAGFFWMAILFVLSLTDYLTRGLAGAPGH